MAAKNGYFSAKQSAMTAINEWKGPKGIVQVTQVGHNPPNFDDVVNLGPVTQWVRTVRKAPKQGF